MRSGRRAAQQIIADVLVQFERFINQMQSPEVVIVTAAPNVPKVGSGGVRKSLPTRRLVEEAWLIWIGWRRFVAILRGWWRASQHCKRLEIPFSEGF